METLNRAFHDRRAVVGAVILGVLGLMALLAPVLAKFPPNQLSNDTWLHPNAQHWLGTTALGQDVFSQLLYGSRLSLLVGLVTGLIATLISVVIGLASAFFGGVVDEILSGITNIFLVLPGLPLVIVTAAYLQVSGVVPVIAVISFTGWAWGARVLRSQALSLRNRDFVQAAIAGGEGPARVIFAEILPNMVGLIAANFFGAALYAVLAEAGLEFLGVGDVSQVTWGTMLYWAQSSQALLQGAWPWIATPGLCIAALGTAFALLNFAVDEVANPRLRSERVAAGFKRRQLEPVRDVPVSDALLQLRSLEAGYLTERGTVRAVKNVNLEMRRGEFLGIAGESGCGKSTLAFAVAQLLRPPGQVLSGEVWLDGQELVRLPPEELRQTRWRDFSMVFQASMNALNPVMRVSDQIADAMRAHGITDAKVIEARAKELFLMVGIRPEYLTAYPHQLSGGMKQRVVIAIALALEPKLVIMDEPTTALDVVVQRSILQEIDAVRRRLNLSIVFITHDLSLLVEMSDRVAIMYAGEIVEQAPSHALYANPLHPYTRRLMHAFPPLEGERTRRDGIAGRPPDLGQPIQGCPFAPRCDRAMAGLCEVVPPVRLEVAPDHVVACHLYDPAVMKGREESRATVATVQ
jgi:peptide/nickel transport system permease protein